MRNLKRALSLTLASVMLLGMMVVGSSAAAGYSDVDENDNVEAIEVLQAVEVMVGDDRGFGPDRPVTRNEMAVVMGKLLNLDYNYYSSTCPFTDVADWAKGWVGACAANGIVSGRGNGIYDGEATVTAIEAASMMMRALGYFKNIEDYADGFATVTVRQGSRIGIFDQVGTDANTAMTRNQVAQMALNALRSEMVDFTGTPGIEVNGVKVGYRAEYTPRTSTEAKYNAIEGRTSDVATEANHKGQYYIQLGEQLYDGKLVLHEYSDDDFMRPARNWEYKGKDIGTYMKKENICAEYTTGVSRRTLYDLLGKTNLVEYDFNYYVDGVAFNTITAEDILTRNTNDYGTTGRGVLTQVFVDIEAETIDIVSINTYLAQAASDYSSSTEKVNLNVYYTYSGNKSVNTSKTVALADVDNIADIKQDEFMLVNVSGKDNSNATQATHPDYSGNMRGYDVVVVSDVEILTDSKLTEFSRSDGEKDADGNTTGSEAIFESVTTGGTKYEGAYYAVYSDEVLDLYANDRLIDKTYNVYLDPYGNAIGVDLYSGDDNYVFITGVDLDSSNISLGTAKAAAIFPDGTMRTITVDVRDTNKNIDKVDGGPVAATATTPYIPGSYFEQWKGGNAAAADNIVGKEYVLNRWYTYTVDANNEYTLNPATRMIVTSIVDGAGDADDTIIKCNNVSIDERASWAGDAYVATVDANGVYTGTTTARNNLGVNRYAAGRGASNNSVADERTGIRTYGNDNSVFIVVEAEEAVTNSNSEKVISDVVGVYTGVQNVEIKVTGPATIDTKIAGTALYDSIYTVYDKNNYIIASVVLGEVQGSTANYVYTLTNAKSERVLDDGTTEWTFDAIVDGTKQTLTARSKYTKTIKDLEPGHIQELRYDGDYVVGVKTPDDVNKYYTDPTAKIGKESIYDVGHVARGVNDSYKGPDCNVSGAHAYVTGTRIDPANAISLRMVGRTMYLGVGYDKGLTFVSENAPAVVIQKEDGSWKLTEHASVASAIGAMGDADAPATPANKAFAGRIVAALNDQGVAKWVVFISDTGITSAGVSVPSNGDDTVTVDPATNTVTVTANGAPDGIAQIAEKVRKEMEKQGYIDIEITVEGDEITKITGKRNGVKYTMKQAGAIEILTDAQLAENAGNRVTALPKNIDLDADDMIGDDEAAAKAAAKAAVKQAVETGRAAGDPAPAEPDTVKTTNGFTLTFTWGAYTAPTTSDAGSIVISSLAIKKGAETKTLTDVTFTIAKLTDEEKAEIDAAAALVANREAVAAAKTAIEALDATALTVENTADGIGTDGIKTAIQNAVDTAANGVTANITVTITKDAKNETADENDDTQGAGDGENGTFSISVALSKGENSAAATGTATNAKGVITAKAYTKP